MQWGVYNVVTEHWSPGGAVAELPRTNLSEPQTADPCNGHVIVPSSGRALDCVIVQCWSTYHIRSVIGEKRALPFRGFGGLVEKLPEVDTDPPLGPRTPTPRACAPTACGFRGTR